MKKQILNLFLCALTLTTVGSCRDALDIIQEGELTNENVYKSTDDLRRVLDGDIYNGMSNSSQIFFTSAFTDEMGIGPNNSDISIGAHQFFVDTTNGDAESIWGNNYYIINRVVRLLDGAKMIAPTEAELPVYNSYLAEARALRGYAYLQLLTYFSTNMADPSALGVIMLDHIPDFSEQLPRVANSEIYKVIEDDLNYAENNILGTANRNGTQFFVSKAMIYATKARYFLYKKDYANAKLYAGKVLAESGLTLTPATPTHDPVSTLPEAFGNNWHRGINAYSTKNPYMMMLQDGIRGEVLFSLSRPTVGAWSDIAGLFATNSSTITGSRYDMGRNLFNILNSVNGDIRKYTYIDPTSRINPDYLTAEDYRKSDALVIDKYPGKSGFPMRNDVKIFRLSEMYFILAECAVAENDLGAAAQYINDIRVARNFKGLAVMPVYGSAKDALTDILLERRIELSFEGHRYIDLKRLGTTAGVAIDRSIVDDFTKDLPTTIPMEDYRWTLPIPRKELQANSVIQQNPGYKATP